MRGECGSGEGRGEGPPWLAWTCSLAAAARAEASALWGKEEGVAGTPLVVPLPAEDQR